MIQFQSKPINIQFEDLNLIFGPSIAHMSREGSFLGQQRNAKAAPPRGDSDSAIADDYGPESDDSVSSYDSTNAFNVFQHELRFKQKNERTAAAREALQAFMRGQQRPSMAQAQREDEERERETMRSIARQVNLKVNNLHIRYEDDYFSGGQPYSMGCVIESMQFMQA